MLRESSMLSFFTPHLHAPTGSTDWTSQRADAQNESRIKRFLKEYKESIALWLGSNCCMEKCGQVLHKPVTYVLLTNVHSGLVQMQCNRWNGVKGRSPVPSGSSNLKAWNLKHSQHLKESFETCFFRSGNWMKLAIWISCFLHYAQASSCASSRQLQFTKAVVRNVRGVFCRGPHRKDWDCLFAKTSMSGRVNLFLLSKGFRHFTLTPMKQPLAIWLWLPSAVRIAN